MNRLFQSVAWLAFGLGGVVLQAQMPLFLERVPVPVGQQTQMVAEVFGVQEGSGPSETAQIHDPTLAPIQLPGLATQVSSHRAFQVVVLIENPGSLHRATLQVESPTGETVPMAQWSLLVGQWRYSCRFPAAAAPEGLCKISVLADGPGQERTILRVLPGGLLLRTTKDGNHLEIAGSGDRLVDLRVEDDDGNLVQVLPSVRSLPGLPVPAGSVPVLSTGQRFVARAAGLVCTLDMEVH